MRPMRWSEEGRLVLADELHDDLCGEVRGEDLAVVVSALRCRCTARFGAEDEAGRRIEPNGHLDGLWAEDTVSVPHGSFVGHLHD